MLSRKLGLIPSHRVFCDSVGCLSFLFFCWKTHTTASLSGETLSKCTKTPPEKLADTWEAYSLNKKVTTLNDRTFKAFRKQVIKNSDAVELLASEEIGAGAITKRPSATVITPSSSNKRSSVFDPTTDRSGGRISMSPQRAPLRATTTSSTTPKPLYKDRRDIGKEVLVFNNPLVDNVDAPPADQPRCNVSHRHTTSNVSRPYRHLFTVLEEQSLQLNQMIEEKTNEFSEKFDFGSEQIAALGAVGVPLQDTVCCIGRICNVVRIFKLLVY